MAQQQFRGTGVAMVTPFHADGSVDYDSLRNVINFLIGHQVEYLVPLGTTGESATISKEEKKAIFQFVKEVNAGRLPLVAGIGGNHTLDILHAFEYFDLTGYDAILSVSPYYNKPSQEGIYQHYKQLATHAPLPIILYNVPSRTGSNVTADTTLRLAHDFKKIIGTKEASGNFDQCMQIIQHRPDGFMVISGDDAITLPLIALGGDGVISVVANAFPKDFAAMTRACLAGDFATARPLHYKLVNIIHTLFSEGSPSGIKAYLKEMGLCENSFRLPVVPVSESLYAKIRHYLAEYR